MRKILLFGTITIVYITTCVHAQNSVNGIFIGGQFNFFTYNAIQTEDLYHPNNANNFLIPEIFIEKTYSNSSLKFGISDFLISQDFNISPSKYLQVQENFFCINISYYKSISLDQIEFLFGTGFFLNELYWQKFFDPDENSLPSGYQTVASFGDLTKIGLIVEPIIKIPGKTNKKLVYHIGYKLGADVIVFKKKGFNYFPIYFSNLNFGISYNLSP